MNLLERINRALRLTCFIILMACCIRMLSGCVTRVTVCSTYDQRLGRETPDRYGRSSAGASVCAEVTPPGVYEEE
jgi:hypothetical protein